MSMQDYVNSISELCHEYFIGNRNNTLVHLCNNIIKEENHLIKFLKKGNSEKFFLKRNNRWFFVQNKDTKRTF